MLVISEAVNCTLDSATSTRGFETKLDFPLEVSTILAMGGESVFSLQAN
jgi:hypothetical protein